MLTHQRNLFQKPLLKYNLLGNLLDVVHDIELHLQTKHFSVFPSLDSINSKSETSKL